ncbi:MAG: EamA family transporter [Fimbriimonas sp.]
MKLSLSTKIAIAFAIVYVVWGSTYLAIRIGLESMPPLLMAGFRFLVAGLLLWGWCELRQEPRGNRKETLNAAYGGIYLVALGNGLVTWAEQSVASGVAALIVAVGPAFTVLLLWTGRTRERPTWSTLLGVALGIAGVGILVAGDANGRVDPLGAVLIVLATLSWSYGVLFCQRAELPTSSLRTNAIQMLSGSAAMMVVGLSTGEAGRVRLGDLTVSSLLALGYLIVFGSILAYSAYGWLIRHVSATAAGTTAFVNPAIAVLLGAFWGEKIGAKAILAMAAILGGVWLLKQKRPERGKVLSEVSVCPKPCETTGA